MKKKIKALHIAFVLWRYYKITLHGKRKLLKKIKTRMTKDYLCSIRCGKNASALACRYELQKFYNYLHYKDNPSENTPDSNTVCEYLGINDK